MPSAELILDPSEGDSGERGLLAIKVGFCLLCPWGAGQVGKGWPLSVLGSHLGDYSLKLYLRLVGSQALPQQAARRPGSAGTLGCSRRSRAGKKAEAHPVCGPGCGRKSGAGVDCAASSISSAPVWWGEVGLKGCQTDPCLPHHSISWWQEGAGGGEMRKVGKLRTRSSLAMAYAFNPRTREGEAGGSL